MEPILGASRETRRFARPCLEFWNRNYGVKRYTMVGYVCCRTILLNLKIIEARRLKPAPPIWHPLHPRNQAVPFSGPSCYFVMPDNHILSP